jgi:site-specific recombinase XerD
MTRGAIQVQSPSLPSIFTAQPQARKRMRDFFSSHIRNANTRRAYLEAVRQFSAYCAGIGIVDLAQVEPIHVAAFVEAQLREHSKPTVKQRLAALRMLFDWMVVGQVIPVNPAHAVRGPKYTQRRGKTPVLQADEARALLDAIDTTSLSGLRDRALIGLMVYTFARVGAAVSMRVEDFFVQGRRGWVRLHEKGGKEHEMPTHHNLDRYLEEYIAAAGIGKDSKQDRKGPLFRTVKGRTGELTANPLLQSDVWRMIRRRASQAGIETEIGCHTFRATGITAYLKNGGRLEIAQQMAAHESARTTGLYDRRGDEISLDEVERIVI